jgi:hypothetical protein
MRALCCRDPMPGLPRWTKNGGTGAAVEKQRAVWPLSGRSGGLRAAG